MKKTALYILLFAYSTVMLKPVAPYISDAVAHIFYYSQHMATVHYENGKLHVHKEIIDNAKKDDPAKENPSSKKENSANDHISFHKNDEQQKLNIVIVHSNPPASFLLTNDPHRDYPPPRA